MIMVPLRRRLRLWATTWILLQVASLAALVPPECCAGHMPAAGAEQGCHEKAAAARCPMKAADGTPCPMHRTGGESKDRCSMRGTCRGPLAALALLSNQGVLPDRLVLSPDLHFRDATRPSREDPDGRLAPPDPPPPRV
jgi:hypothetical protein